MSNFGTVPPEMIVVDGVVKNAEQLKRYWQGIYERKRWMEYCQAYDACTGRGLPAKAY